MEDLEAELGAAALIIIMIVGLGLSMFVIAIVADVRTARALERIATIMAQK